MENKSFLNILLTVALAAWVLVIAVKLGLTEWQEYAANKQSIVRQVPEWQSLIIGRTPSLGAESAQFVIIEFSDYQCPFCGMADSVLAKFAARHAGDVVVYRYDMPLRQIHRYAFVAALAANCAELQGVIEPYQSLLFQHQKEFATLDWTALAKQAGVVNADAFAKCVRDTTPRNRILNDIEKGESIGISSTPSFLINGTLLSGELSGDKLESLYGDIRKKHRGFLHGFFNM